jgi:hypothetical protein
LKSTKIDFVFVFLATATDENLPVISTDWETIHNRSNTKKKKPFVKSLTGPCSIEEMGGE